MDDESLYRAIRNVLIDEASASRKIFYSVLGRRVEIFGNGQGWVTRLIPHLDRIDQGEVAAKRPMLAAIVVTMKTGRPGKGFFPKGQELRQTLPGEDEKSFAERQLRLVHDHWSR